MIIIGDPKVKNAGKKAGKSIKIAGNKAGKDAGNKAGSSAGKKTSYSN